MRPLRFIKISPASNGPDPIRTKPASAPAGAIRDINPTPPSRVEDFPAAILPQAIAQLQAKGYRFVTVTELFRE